MLMLWYFFDKCGQNSIDKKGKFSNKKNSHIHYTHLYIIYKKKDQEEVQVLDDLIFFFDNFF